MIFNVLTSIIFAAAVGAMNPKVSNPQNMTYQAGSKVDIHWESAETGFVNIDLVDADSNVLQFPLAIASGVNAEAGKFTWEVPATLKSANGYQIRVWGSHQPTAQAGEGVSQMFTILNTLPNAVTAFTVVTPNKDKPCAAGTTCRITWDFPPTANYPAFVHINLYKVGQTEPITQIATVESSFKIFDWVIPQNFAEMGSDLYISVSGEGMPQVGPTMANSMGGNSHAFAMQPVPPVEIKENTPKKETPKRINKPKMNTPEKLEGQVANGASITLPSIGAILMSAALLVPFAFAL